jgi:hypothetical protein
LLECRRRGIDVYRFNSEDYPSKVGIEIEPLNGSAVLLDAAERIEISEARGIWLWRPQWPVPDDAIDDVADRALVFQESVAALAGAWRILGQKCISPPDSIQRARWKLHQLHVATILGFAVPETFVTTEPSAAQRFLEEAPAVVKAVADSRVVAGGIERYGAVQLVQPDTPLDSVQLAPTMFQRPVTKSGDLRVTVIGARLFSIVIRTPEGGPLDFREADPFNCQYEPIELRPEDALRCRDFMRHYGLRYSAFDFALTPSGGLVFLECNPGGHWGWLEAHTGLPMTAALVDLLISPWIGDA